jgi:SAM-dependent methyltransferase
MPPRFDVECPNCWSLERHRLIKLWLDDHPGLIVGREILHFAPEPAVKSFVKPLACRYVAADLIAKNVDKNINIEDIDERDCSYDMVICSHVLEHVNDDGRALREMCRILRPGGIALFMFPIVSGWNETYENAAIVGEKEREIHFGQRDHVRIYGRDVRSRIMTAGFNLEEFAVREPFVSRHNLQRGEILYIGRRTAEVAVTLQGAPKRKFHTSAPVPS